MSAAPALLKHALTLVAVAYAFWQIRALVLGQASWCWQPTRAWVIEAHLDERLQREPYRRIVHSAHVRYRYSHGGRAFESRRLSYRPTDLLGFAHANAFLDGLAMNRETTAYVDPRHPARAVLVQGAESGNLVRLVAAALGLGAVISLPS